MAELRTSKTWSTQEGFSEHTAQAPAIWDPVLRFAPNGEFGRTTGEYVAVVHGRIGIPFFSTGAAPIVVRVGLGTEFADPLNPTIRPNSIHSVRFDQGLIGAGADAQVGVPFTIVERFTMPEDLWWQMAVRVASPAQGQLVRIENITVTLWSLDHLTPARYDWTEFSGGITLPISTGTSGAAGQDPAWEIPLVDSANANWALGKWASFYCSRVNPNNIILPSPGPSQTPSMIAQRISDPSSANDTWPGPVLPRFGLRGMYRLAGSNADGDTRFMLGGCNVIDIDEPNRRVGVVGQDVQNLGLVDHTAQFSVLLEDIAGQGVTSVDDGSSPGFQVYKDKLDTSETTELSNTFRIAWEGEAYRNGTYWTECVYPPRPTSGNPETADIIGDAVLLNLTTFDANRLPARPRPLLPLFISRKRFEPVIDCAAGEMDEIIGPLALELVGESVGRTLTSSIGPYRSERFIRAAGFTLLWFRDFVGTEPDVVVPESPGEYTQIYMTREGPTANQFVRFPVPPMNATTGQVHDPEEVLRTVDGTKISWPLSVLGPRFEWRLSWTLDTERHPSWLPAMQDYIDGPNFPFVRWRSPDAEAEKHFIVIPDSVQWTGPRAGIWGLSMSVFEIVWLEGM